MNPFLTPFLVFGEQKMWYVPLKLNHRPVQLTVDPDRMLLWVLRTDLGLTGTKYGCGEPAIITMGAVIANAIFDAVGARVFQLPMTPERIKEASAAL